jgi:sugar/nucleoside kinase (ribokinase family)
LERFDFDALGLKEGQCVFLGHDETIKMRDAIAEMGLGVSFLPGGSAANVLSCYAALGGKSSFIGKAAEDDCGAMFRQSLQEWGIQFLSAPAIGQVSSTQIFTFISPNGERSFAANYGASHMISPNDVRAEHIGQCDAIVLDGYMLMSDHGPETLKHTVELARQYGRSVIFMPADLSVIEARYDDVRWLMQHCDAVICNAEQAMALTGDIELDHAVERLAGLYDYGCVTLGEDGVKAYRDGKITHAANPYTPEHIVSTNGAGDNFAGGFLYGLFHGLPVRLACHLGMYCALDVLKRQSPRPEKPLVSLLETVIEKARSAS